MKTSRRLAALMFTDMVGYSALAREDESMARELVDDQRVIVREALKLHDGRELQTTGDGFFIEFASAVNAVECAVRIQTELHEKSRYLPEDRRIKIRIGIHIGDILSNDEDLYGNSVNIAARIEPMARPGGICITRQVYEQVNEKIEGIDFKQVGKASLKNIRGGADIYHVLLPHEKVNHKSSPRFSNAWRRFQQFRQQTSFVQFNKASLFTSTLASLFLLSFAIAGGLMNVFNGGTSAERTPASLASPLTDISSDWKYKTEGMTDWSDFDIKKSWRYADDITGKFKLSKRFETSNDYKSPSIVLGIIRDRHRVYLNGNFIGGADRHTDLAMYTFDPRLLKAGSNEILVEAETERSLNPGLSMIPDVGTSLGEFSEISEKVRSNTIRFHVLRNVYFGLALTVLIGCFGFLIARRVPMNFVYSFSILLFSSLQLAYYSPWINETFDYPFVRFLKIAGLAITSLLLIPAFSKVYAWQKTEVVGNLMILIFSGLSATLLFDSGIAPSIFTDRYNLVIGIALAISLPWAVAMLVKMGSALLKSERTVSTAFGFAYLLSSFFLTSSMLVSLKAGVSQMFVPDAIRRHFIDFSLTFPLLFSTFVIGIAIHDYIQQSKSAKARRKKDSLILEAAHVISKTMSVNTAISELQRTTCAFLQATRSTVYVLQDSNSSPTLLAEFSFNSSDSSKENKAKAVISVSRGVIAYTLKNLTPLLIEDIRTDRRFSDLKSDYSRDSESRFNTGSCMIFPLTSNGKVVGAITYADKESHLPFSKDDFEAALQISTQLALLIDNRRLAEQYRVAN